MSSFKRLSAVRYTSPSQESTESSTGYSNGLEQFSLAWNRISATSGLLIKPSADGTFRVETHAPSIYTNESDSRINVTSPKSMTSSNRNRSVSSGLFRFQFTVNDPTNLNQHRGTESHAKWAPPCVFGLPTKRDAGTQIFASNSSQNPDINDTTYITRNTMSFRSVTASLPQESQVSNVNTYRKGTACSGFGTFVRGQSTSGSGYWTTLARIKCEQSPHNSFDGTCSGSSESTAGFANAFLVRTSSANKSKGFSNPVLQARDLVFRLFSNGFE
ncbi:hypothetical protein DPMN_106489 [Dreissena polymorpha]|uniref:Uncharacterized protein n=2 Tax=Dreissena polymorpha TaxID=45954 RepID=A0A9D4K588_DREPO|nr:hypothetical protein DPMN_106489 [Dreissena polymorpha]